MSKLESLVKQFLDSLLDGKKHSTLCLNINDDSFDAAQFAFDYAKQKNAAGLQRHDAPTPTQLKEILEMIAGRTVIVTFDDLDKHPKHIDILAAHVKAPHPGGHLIVVSKLWNPDNTPKERELRKTCLFYQYTREQPPQKK